MVTVVLAATFSEYQIPDWSVHDAGQFRDQLTL